VEGELLDDLGSHFIEFLFLFLREYRLFLLLFIDSSFIQKHDVTVLLLHIRCCGIWSLSVKLGHTVLGPLSPLSDHPVYPLRFLLDIFNYLFNNHGWVFSAWVGLWVNHNSPTVFGKKSISSANKNRFWLFVGISIEGFRDFWEIWSDDFGDGGWYFFSKKRFF
jgi:hypothetical protein